MADDAPPLLTLPDGMRSALKEPLGPIFTDAEALLEHVDGPLIAVGDVVTHHFEHAGRSPDVAVVDEYTERESIDPEVRRSIEASDAVRVEARNPAATLSASMLETLREAIDRDGETLIVVDGEEDLVALPAILAAPEGASVVYGQPGEGMVHVVVTEETRAEARALVERMEGDHGRVWELLS